MGVVYSKSPCFARGCCCCFIIVQLFLMFIVSPLLILFVVRFVIVATVVRGDGGAWNIMFCVGSEISHVIQSTQIQ